MTEPTRPWRRHLAVDRLGEVLFALPALGWFGAVVLLPFIGVLYVSSLRWQGLLATAIPVGIENYVSLIGDARMARALVNTAILGAVGWLFILPLAFMLGFFLSLRPKGHRLLGTILFAPAIMSVTALSMMFVGVYQPDGLLNSVLRAIDLEALTHFWLADSTTAMAAVIGVSIWGSTGFYAVLFAAALGDVPGEIYEAAELDGASTWTQVRRIAAPIAREMIGVVAVLILLDVVLGSAQMILLLTQGGPVDTTLTIGYLLYEKAFVTYDLGYSQAIATSTLVFGLVAMLFIRRRTARNF